MKLCYAVLTPVVVIARTLVQVVREIVRTVCEWVSRLVHTVKTIVETICSWLPWPLSTICNLVTKLIEVVETVWNWVCHEVIDRIVDWVERIVEYTIYVLRWVCWIVSWPGRLPGLLLCRLGVRPKRFIHLCIRVLTDEKGTPAVEWDKVDGDLKQASEILGRCNIDLVVADRNRVVKPEFLDGTSCGFAGVFSDFFTWFSANECETCAAVTVYYVRSIPRALGCAYPGTNWVTVPSDGDGRFMVQEIGHLADMWAHSSDPDNVMTDQTGKGTGDQVTPGQCCMFRTSRFALSSPCPRLGPLALREGQLEVEALHTTTPRASNVAQAIASVGIVVWLASRSLRALRR
jgi:hypothetical protein